ncbi:hypothetical protein CANCADRAFT_21099 [Tortispora caseinolytica NRRL Y-17796]|uniref:BHLH domain-containing protein n=1 Tax=Tortispora caseinolytica NRRL Y-17796 TaxID=767744 RepID=A0A1E4TMH6_9ASCO|nr:hypothetical protein CANCADRAFT_21099 [Tortispora caseinolytica NRRL Y-17796]
MLNQANGGIKQQQAHTAVSTDWQRQRKDCHKEVERRRRETISNGIEKLAKLIPHCDKSKGAILAKAAEYIQELKENEHANFEKWTVEKLTAEQTIAELSHSNETLKNRLEQAYREAELWKRTCQQAGIKRAGTGAQ